MGENFGPDLLVSIIGAVFGSVLTVAIALVTFLIQRRRSEKQALQSLINEIHHRRALIDHGQPRTVPDAAETDDYRQCASSVMSIRDEIRRTRDVVRPGSPTQPVLSQMTRSCNGYLDATAAQPPRYWIELMVLRERLSDSLRTISSQTSGVKFAQPGDGAS